MGHSCTNTIMPIQMDSTMAEDVNVLVDTEKDVVEVTRTQITNTYLYTDTHTSYPTKTRQQATILVLFLYPVSEQWVGIYEV